MDKAARSSPWGTLGLALLPRQTLPELAPEPPRGVGQWWPMHAWALQHVLALACVALSKRSASLSLSPRVSVGTGAHGLTGDCDCAIHRREALSPGLGLLRLTLWVRVR